MAVLVKNYRYRDGQGGLRPVGPRTPRAGQDAARLHHPRRLSDARWIHRERNLGERVTARVVVQRTRTATPAGGAVGCHVHGVLPPSRCGAAVVRRETFAARPGRGRTPLRWDGMRREVVTMNGEVVTVSSFRLRTWDISTDVRAGTLSSSPLTFRPFRCCLLILCHDEADHRWHWRVHCRTAGDWLRVCAESEGGVESEARRVVDHHSGSDNNESANAPHDHSGSDHNESATPNRRDHGPTHRSHDAAHRN